MKKLMLSVSLLAATPAMAATGPFFSLGNTDFVVLLAFILFVAILLVAKVPAKIGGLLDNRAALIKAELEEAKLLREEARVLLASYEKKQKEVLEQSEQIVTAAKAEAMAAAAKAKEDLKSSIARRLAAAEEQIGAAEAAALRQVRDRAVTVAVAAAAQVLSAQKTEASASASIDAAIGQVEARFH